MALQGPQIYRIFHKNPQCIVELQWGYAKKETYTYVQ